MDLVTTLNLAFVDAIGFDPFFRGFLSVLTGVVVLMGSTYLIVATNVGARLGFLLSLAGLFGWGFLMGIIWTVYGIGWNGQAPVWAVVEINVDDPQASDDGPLFSNVDAVKQLAPGQAIPAGGLGTASFDAGDVSDRFGPDTDPAAALSGANTVGDINDGDVAQQAALVASRELDLGDWRYLTSSDAIRGEAQASADAILIEEGIFAPGEYLPQPFGTFVHDGKPVLKEDANVVDRVLHTLNETILHPVYDRELIVVQVQAVTDQAALPGQPPPVVEADNAAPVVSVVMERDRGGPLPQIFSGLRFTPAMFTVFNGLLFGVVAWNLHLRDRKLGKIRAATA